MARIERSLRQFLREENAYVKFCHYFRKNGEVTGEGKIEIFSIKWSETKEGVDYWIGLLRKYRELKYRKKIYNKYFK